MESFATFDLNGWLDHLVVGGNDGGGHRSSTLGFRSCLVRHGKTWLFGAQALAAAREQSRHGADVEMIDAIDALATTARHGDVSPEDRRALPAALWQSVANAAQRSNDPINLALVVPDGRFLGRTRVARDGRTPLESLHAALVKERPIELVRSRVELIWRSVAVLQAARSADALRERTGRVLVISVNRRTFWTLLELRRWCPDSSDGDGAICIARSGETDDCNDDEAWTARRLATVEESLAAEPKEKIDSLKKWTRAVETLACGMSSASLREFGIQRDGIEQRIWPDGDGNWEHIAQPQPPSNWPAATLPERLRAKLESVCTGNGSNLLAVVLECPTGLETISRLARSIREAAPGVPVVTIVGRQTAEAALDLAFRLGRDPRAPPWLDVVPQIEFEVRPRAVDGSQPATIWKSIIPRDEAIPAGETYHTRPRGADNLVRLAPGVEHVHLHLRRGGSDERYSGKATGHTILASDHQRFIEPVASVRPLSGEARVEIKERRDDGGWEALAGSRASVKWSDMTSEPPSALRSIPELYVFEASEEGWKDVRARSRRGDARPGVESLLKDVPRADNVRMRDIQDKLYQATKTRWEHQKFPLDSSGQPPRSPDEDPKTNTQRQHLLLDATRRLLEELEEHVEANERPKDNKVANRLHLPLTWLFTACPERAVEILIDAALGHGNAPNVLHFENDYSAWSVYQGIGRAAKSEEALAVIFDELIGLWDGERQDKFLLAAVTHPLARRVATRTVLGERKERFLRVESFLRRQLENLLNGVFDPRPDRRGQQSLELRYITMGYRGLCQLRYHHEDWFPIDADEAQWAFDNLHAAKRYGREYERELVEKSAPYLIGEGEDPTMPGGF